jgi:hypothetical protein
VGEYPRSRLDISRVTLFGTPDTSESALTLETGEASRPLNLVWRTVLEAVCHTRCLLFFLLLVRRNLRRIELTQKFGITSCQDKHKLTRLRFRLNSASSAKGEQKCI